MRSVAADLHIHTALSPCASNEMTPEAIVYNSIARDLEIIAICDHNSAENVKAVQEAAEHTAGDLFLVLPGMEITTAEEAHVVALFPCAEAALAVSRQLAVTLPRVPRQSDLYGEQRIMNARGEVIGQANELLSFASAYSLDETALLIREHGGLVIAAHVDRPSFSVESQLGFIPETPVFDALEISAAGFKQGKAKNYESPGMTLISSSDAHYKDNIGDGRCILEIESLSFEEVQLALNAQKGRSCSLA
ncbi:MAG: PHP domain-containing protein [Candidatus Hydrogenedens sp.]|jgi:PHP family Zn ribbon phosphoesterase|nr:PHP domain-containing protein [Candidatus Hydrogenedens sp.]